MPRTDDPDWPAIPLAPWRETFATLHMWLQIVGKTRLAFAPHENHWWQVALYVTPTGLTTSTMPAGAIDLEVEIDFVAHVLTARRSGGQADSIELVPQSVAEFHSRYRTLLQSLGIDPPAFGKPVEVEIAVPFAEDRADRPYDRDAVHRWWTALRAADRVMKRFRSRFVGKQSPSHFFWGSFDLATTRFSGRTAPTHPGGAPNCPDYVMVEAYSRECSSCGFWPGGGAVDEAAFYAYAYPQPVGYAARAVLPREARYDDKAGEFILPYEAVRTSANPEEALMEFLQSTYDAAADTGRWERATLDRG